MKLRPFLDIHSGKGRLVFLENDCDCKNEYTLEPDTPVQSFLGVLNTTSLSLNVRRNIQYIHNHDNFFIYNHGKIKKSR
jgi:hypothetical protein